jgi:hypothetical protein
LNINQGDYVLWSWGASSTIGQDIKYFIQQVEDPISKTPIGFASGYPTRSGKFTFNILFK